MHKTQNDINARHKIKPLYMHMQQITFYDNRGRVETADMTEVMFSDGVQRFICTHAHVPESYLPRDVYALNEETSEYTAIGAYTTTETKSTQWFNAYANIWQGSPSIKSYIFHEN
jgi:hypothetical protein